MIFDIWFEIIKNVCFTCDIICIRNVESTAKEAFSCFLKSIESDVHARRTMIQINTCMICSNFQNDIHQIVYHHDQYPKRRILYCNKASCFCNSFKRFVIDCDKENLCETTVITFTSKFTYTQIQKCFILK